MKKTILMMVLLCVEVVAWCQMSQNVTVNGVSNHQFVKQMTFSGDNVVMTYDGGSSETKDMGQVGIGLSYAVSLSQADSEGNGQKLQIFGGRVVDVNVARTVKSSYWAPVCFPFSMSQDQIAEAFGSDARVTKLTKATESSIVFSRVSAMNAGEPYLIRLGEGQADVTAFSLKNVALSNFTSGATVQGSDYQFVGTIPQVTLLGDTYYYFTTSGTMRPLTSGNSILAMRGYMQSLGAAAAKELLFCVDETTGIARMGVDGLEVTEGDIYNVNGQKVGGSAAVLHKGIYIVNGKKVVVK